MFNYQKYLIYGIIGVIVLAVFSLSSGLINPSWNPFKQLPSGAVLETGFANLAKIEKMRTDVLLDLDIKINASAKNVLKNALKDQAIEPPSKASGSLNIVQIIDKTNKENKKSSSDFNLSIGVEGLELSMAGKLIAVDKKLFLNIASLPEFLPLGIDLETIKNQWLLIEPQALGLAQESLSKITLQDAAFTNDLKMLLAGKQIFKIKRTLNQQIVDNENCQHYFVEVPKQTFKKMFPEFINLMVKYADSSNSQAYQQNVQQTLTSFQQNFEAIWTQIGGLGFEAWLNDGGVIKKIKFNKTISGSSVNLEILFSDFNKDQAIEPPLDYKPIANVLPSSWLGELATSTNATSTQ